MEWIVKILNKCNPDIYNITKRENNVGESFVIPTWFLVAFSFDHKFFFTFRESTINQNALCLKATDYIVFPGTTQKRRPLLKKVRRPALAVPWQLVRVGS